MTDYENLRANAKLIPWNFVNGYMNDDNFRELVQRTAWIQRSKAPKELRTYSDAVLVKTVTVRGFRPKAKAILSIAYSTIKEDLNKSMWKHADTSAAIIALWADAEQQLVDSLHNAIRDSGLSIAETWDWKQGIQGFYDLNLLGDILNIAAQVAPSNEITQWKYSLASLWLSGGIGRDNGINPLNPSFPFPNEHELRVEEMGDTENSDYLHPQVNLSEMYDRLNNRAKSLDENRKEAKHCLDRMNEGLESAITETLVELSRDLSSCLTNRFTIERELLAELDRDIQFLEKELAYRPDLITNIGLLSENFGDLSLHPDRIVSEILEIVESIAAYDTARKKTISDCQILLNQIINLRLQLNEIEIDTNSLDEFGQSFTLEASRSTQEALDKDYQSLSERLSQKRQTTLDEIAKMIESLAVIPIQLLPQTINLDEFDIEKLALYPLDRLTEIHAQVNNILQSQVSLAAPLELSENPTRQEFLGVLIRLAESHADLELLLLLLSGYISNNLPFDLDLPDVVIEGIIQCIERISGDASPFYTFNRIAPLLLNRWTTSSPYSQAKIQLMIIGADCTQERLPPGTAWQFPIQQWPLPNTSTWAQLWELILLSETIPDLLDETSSMGILSAKEQFALQMLAKENGRYTRAGAIKSAKHSGVLANHLFPELEQYLSHFIQLNNSIDSYPEDEQDWRLAREMRQLQQELEFFAQENLQVRYDEAILLEGVRDSNRFLHEKALKIYFECAQRVADYGYFLIETINQKIDQSNQLSRQKLLNEIAAYSELKPLAIKVIDQIASTMNKNQVAMSDPSHTLEQGLNYIVSAIFADPNCGLRFPSLIGALVNEDSSFSEWYVPLLEDISQAHDVDQVGEMLLGNKAFNQILLSSNFSLDIQIRAQELQAQVVKEVTQLEAKLMHLGGEIDDLKVFHKTGRWGLLERKLNARIQVVEQKILEGQSQLQNRQLLLIDQVYDLERRIVTDSYIPQDIKQKLQQGLSLIRQTAINNKFFDGIDQFLKGITYRIDHRTWNILEIQAEVDRLKEACEDKVVSSKNLLTAEQVLDYLERRELAQLGFGENAIQFSNVETRSRLLETWIKVKNIKVFMSSGMNSSERQAIHDLCRHFATMCSIQQVLTLLGDHIWDESISPFGLYQLRYPKTEILDNVCVFISLPSAKPKAEDRQALQEMITGKEWLPDRFVIIFIPGCTPQLKTALENEYRKLGLVVVDEVTLLEMVLAETNGNKPVGKLRALMLNSKPLQHIDIFKINQLVESRKSIFVGRDNLVEQVATSGDNYALYGGRRIGKSSVLNAVRDRLERRDIKTTYFSFEGRGNPTDNASASALGRELQLPPVRTVDDLRLAIESHMNAHPSLRIVILLDEIDKYIEHNSSRHLLIETLRSLSENYTNRFRVIVAGFMNLYDCLKLRGPYTATSDPWRRMFREKLLENLTADNAESIVREGFIEILGWDFQHRSIPQGVVERTGGHPAFVQKFCENLQQHIARRNDKKVMLQDLDVVFNDTDSENGFMSYVRSTLVMNLDPVARFVILWLAKTSEDLKSFRFEQLVEYANLLEIPEPVLTRSIEHLLATSVIKQISLGLFEFTVPDYPLILSRLGDTALSSKELEEDVKKYLMDKWPR